MQYTKSPISVSSREIDQLIQEKTLDNLREIEALLDQHEKLRELIGESREKDVSFYRKHLPVRKPKWALRLWWIVTSFSI
jgi:hypothetical protein